MFSLTKLVNTSYQSREYVMGKVIKFPEPTEDLVEVEFTTYDSGEIKEVLECIRETIATLKDKQNVPGIAGVVKALYRAQRELT